MIEGAVSQEAVAKKNLSVAANRYVLNKRSAVTLLEKLSSDDAFRASYMANPRDALLGIGVSASELPENMRALDALADKPVFAAALQEVEADLAAVYSCLRPPTVRFNANA